MSVSLNHTFAEPFTSQPDTSPPASPSLTAFSSSSTLFSESSLPGSFCDSSDTETLATSHPLGVIEEGSRGTGRKTETRTPSEITIVEEGRDWWGYGDEGVRRAAVALGIGFNVPCHGVNDRGSEGDVRKDDRMAFWHENGRLVECVVSEDGADDECGNLEVDYANIRRRRVGLKDFLVRLVCGVES